ncbi:MAG: DUF1592 domain-containing protein [Myxococcales bacterium]|nr:DUF1592 domain-containing protein [Myxococcales bacterium]
MRIERATLALAVALTACTAHLEPDALGPHGSRPGGSATELALEVSPSAARRLTAAELDATLEDLLDDTSAPASRLLGDGTVVFDPGYEVQGPSQALVEGIEQLAYDVAERAMPDADGAARVTGCALGGGADDDACLEGWLRRFGRRLLRRPVEDEEVDELVGLYHGIAVDEAGAPWLGAQTVLAALLQHPELHYHVEVGTPVGGDLVRLTSYEVASRVSFFLWGAAPDDRLLDLAAGGDLDDAEGRRAVALEMLEDDRARVRMETFHAQWLGYDYIAHEPEMAARMRRESDALVDRVLFEEHGPWTDLFGYGETYVDDTLAALYGMETTGSDVPRWARVDDPNRGTLLAHGSFLAQGGKFDDTSPVSRGMVVTTRLRCTPISDPPPGLRVNADEPPPGDACKWERYSEHRTNETCAGCHRQLDGVGFGLEGWDTFARERWTEPSRDECGIDSVGQLPGIDREFRGPRQLSDALLEAGELDACAVEQVYRFAVGRYRVRDEGRQIDEWVERFRDSGYDFAALLAEVVASEAFVHRRISEEE